MTKVSKEFDVFGLHAIFGELASNDPAVNKDVVSAINLGTTTVGVTAGIGGGASVFKR